MGRDEGGAGGGDCKRLMVGTESPRKNAEHNGGQTACVRRTIASIAGGGRGICRKESERGRGQKGVSSRDGGDGCNLHVSVEGAAAADVMLSCSCNVVLEAMGRSEGKRGSGRLWGGGGGGRGELAYFRGPIMRSKHLIQCSM